MSEMAVKTKYWETTGRPGLAFFIRRHLGNHYGETGGQNTVMRNDSGEAN